MGRMNYSANFKAERVIEVLREEKELGEIAARQNTRRIFYIRPLIAEPP